MSALIRGPHPLSENGDAAMTKLEHRTVPPSRRPQPGGARTVIVIILVAFFAAAWSVLVVGLGLPPQVATTGLGAATGLALRLAAGVGGRAPASRRV